VGLLVAVSWQSGSPPPRPEPTGEAAAPSVDLDSLDFDAWLREVRGLPAERQVEAVAARLKKRNPGFDGRVLGQTDGGAVTRIELLTDHVSDLLPVQAVGGLKALVCRGSAPDKGRLANLAPLVWLRLTSLECPCNKVVNLTPLVGMPLKDLDVHDNPVTDLAPLRRVLLSSLDCASCPVSDLSPLKGMKLTSLDCAGAPVTDLTPLEGMPLQTLRCDFHPWRDAEALRGLAALRQINGKPAAEFWKDEDAKRAAFEGWCNEVAGLPAEEQANAVAARLRESNPGFDGEVKPTIASGVVTALDVRADDLTDLSPVRALTHLKALTCSATPPARGKLADLSPLGGMRLTSLWCSNTRVADLSPLRGMPLIALHIDGTEVADLSPLQGMRLKQLHCPSTPVADLSPLQGMRLTHLVIGRTQVADLSPLKGMPLLSLGIAGTPATDLSPLEGLPLKALGCQVRGERDVELLRSIKTLETINNRPAAEVLREAAARPTPGP
jgi:Leucine-rich repeat (LRR) protein